MKYLESPIFYMGNKYKLLKYIIPLFPKECNNFLDAFGGSGVICMNYKGKNKTVYNDFNYNIVELIKMIINNEPSSLNEYWKNKIEYYNLRNKSNKNNCKETRGDYYKMRNDYNNSKNKDYKDLYLLACYSINHLIRFNKNNEFNASSGNDSYNERNYNKIINFHYRMKDVEIKNKNIFDLDLKEYDFIYFDPPYSNSKAVYNEKRAFGGWSIEEDYKLFKVLEELSNKNIKWGLSNVFVNRGKENTHLIEWCNKNKWNIHHLNRNYNPFSRGNSNNDEIFIKNY